MTFTPSMKNATIRDRLDVIEQRLAMVQSAIQLLANESDDEAVFPKPVLLAAALDDLGRCHDEVEWLQSLPNSVLKRPLPTLDELDEAKAAS